jgi:hypothetical protein
MIRLKNIFIYFIPPTLLYLLHLFLDISFDVYTRFSWFDKLMHFSGGAVLVITFFPLLTYFEKRGNLKLGRIWKFIFVISLVVLVAVLWEFYEFVICYFCGCNWQPSVADTIADLALGMFGGLIVTLIFSRME